MISKKTIGRKNFNLISKKTIGRKDVNNNNNMANDNGGNDDDSESSKEEEHSSTSSPAIYEEGVYRKINDGDDDVINKSLSPVKVNNNKTMRKTLNFDFIVTSYESSNI